MEYAAFYFVGLFLCAANQVLPVELEYGERGFDSRFSPIHQWNIRFLYFPLGLAFCLLVATYARVRPGSAARRDLGHILFPSVVANAFPVIFNSITAWFHISFPFPFHFVGFVLFAALVMKAIVRQSAFGFYVPRREPFLSVVKTILFGFVLLLVFYMGRGFTLLDAMPPLWYLLSVGLLTSIVLLVGLKIASDRLSGFLGGPSELALLKHSVEECVAQVSKADEPAEIFQAIASFLRSGLSIDTYLLARYSQNSDRYVIETQSGFDTMVSNGGYLEGIDELRTVFAAVRITPPKRGVFGAESESVLGTPRAERLRQLGIEAVVPLLHWESLPNAKQTERRAVALGFALLGRSRQGDTVSREQIDIVQERILVVAVARLCELRERSESRFKDKMAALDNYAAGLLHDLKVPLGGVAGLIEWIIKRSPQEDVTSDLENARLTVTSCIERIRRALAITEVGTREPVRIEEVLEAAEARLGDHGLDVKRNIASCLPEVLGEWEHLIAAFENILSNALRAWREHRERPNVLRISVHVLETSDGTVGVEVVIEDQGIGMAQTDVDRIFDPGFSTRPKPGSGLGLAHTKRIVERHGGRIFVDSFLGKGTKVRVFLPADGRNVSGGRP